MVKREVCMNEVMLHQYNLLSKELQQEVQHYIEYLFLKNKKLNKKTNDNIMQQEKDKAYETLVQYAGCIPPDIDYKHVILEETVKNYESLN